MLILPRQARDKHRENSLKRPFSCLSADRIDCTAANAALHTEGKSLRPASCCCQGGAGGFGAMGFEFFLPVLTQEEEFCGHRAERVV
jgi:hypothetical protein